MTLGRDDVGLDSDMASAAFEARYYGDCPTCRNSIEPGDAARYDDFGDACHVGCAVAVERRAEQSDDVRLKESVMGTNVIAECDEPGCRLKSRTAPVDALAREGWMLDGPRVVCPVHKMDAPKAMARHKHIADALDDMVFRDCLAEWNLRYVTGRRDETTAHWRLRTDEWSVPLLTREVEIYLAGAYAALHQWWAPVDYPGGRDAEEQMQAWLATRAAEAWSPERAMSVCRRGAPRVR